MGSSLVKIDEDTYRFNRLIINKKAIADINKAINSNISDESIRKIYNLIFKL